MPGTRPHSSPTIRIGSSSRSPTRGTPSTTPTWHRPDGLLIGCAIGLVLAEPESRLAHGLIRVAQLLRMPVILGILILVAATASSHAAWQVYYGLALFNLCVGLLMVDLLARPTSRIAGFFGFRPFAWVGRRTYFIYAVHLAVFMLAFDVLGLTTLPEIGATTVLVFAAAGISYRYYEDPIRRWGYRMSNSILKDDRTRVAPAGTDRR